MNQGMDPEARILATVVAPGLIPGSMEDIASRIHGEEGPKTSLWGPGLAERRVAAP